MSTGRSIELTAADGHAFAAFENAPAGAAASVVVIQEIFGVNGHIRSVVDSFADAGYRAIAPALFDRSERGVELDYTAEGIAEGRELKDAIDWPMVLMDVAATVAHVASTGPVGTVGYCWGGSIAWLAAAELPVAASVGYYGGAIHELRERNPLAPTLLHFGANDRSIPLNDIAGIRLAHPDLPVHVYDEADHGFNCDARASFNPAVAELAKQRTLAFFAKHGVVTNRG